MDSYVKAAFDAVCGGGHFVCLMESEPYYGGPEEGGWWGADTRCVAYREYPTEAAALEARDRVRALAEELSADSRREYGRTCLEQTAWLEARGLDDSFLPEVEGEVRYYVIVSTEVPEESFGSRTYS